MTAVHSDKCLLEESYGSHAVHNSYVYDDHGSVKTLEDRKPWTSVIQTFKAIFLPQGYPDSVSEDYLTYQIWDTIQAFCSSITGALAAQAVLKGVGVGDENATVLAATMTWIIKDGTGMIGRILFAWMQGSYLDHDCKRWRLFADILNDAAICLEILAPGFQMYFTPIVCVAGVCKSIVGVAGGATRAALTQHQARRNNMADVSAKDGSQETLVNLAGLLCNLLLIPVVTGNTILIWFLFLVFTFFHLLSNYKAVTCVKMETLNQARLHIVMKEYLKSGYTYSVKDANLKEPVVLRLKRRLAVHFGCSAQNLIKSQSHLQQLTTIFANSNYLMNIDFKTGQIFVIFYENAQTTDFLQAAVISEVLDFCVSNLHQNEGDIFIQNITEAARHHDTISALSHCQKWLSSNYKQVEKDLKAAGWDLSKTLFCIDEWRVRTNNSSPGYNLRSKNM